jgi:hypothetical protein
MKKDTVQPLAIIENEEVLPFEMTRDGTFRVNIKAIGLVETSINNLEREGEDFLEAFNKNINKLKLKKDEPNVAVIYKNNKEIHINYGFSVTFIDGQRKTTYYFYEPLEVGKPVSFSEVPDGFEETYNRVIDFVHNDLETFVETIGKTSQ